MNLIMAEDRITFLKDALDFLEVHWSLMREIIDEKEFPLPMRSFSKSLLASMDRYHSTVRGNNWVVLRRTWVGLL